MGNLERGNSIICPYCTICPKYILQGENTPKISRFNEKKSQIQHFSEAILGNFGGILDIWGWGIQ